MKRHFFLFTLVAVAGLLSISCGNSIDFLKNPPAATSATKSAWVNEAYIKAPNADANDAFGEAVSLSGDTLAVGVSYEGSGQTTITNGTTASTDNSVGSSGAVYVFRRSGATWNNEAYIKAPNAGMYDRFGSAVSLSGDTLAVGTHLEDSNQTTITNGTTATADDSVTRSGAAYVFRRSGTTWSTEAYIKAPNAGSEDKFGTSVSLSGDTLAVGAYCESSNQTTITNGTTANTDNSLGYSGAVYVFRRSDTTWTNEAYIKAPNAGLNGQFGTVVSLSGDTLSVGANQESNNQTTITNGTTANTDNSLGDSGAVYVFRRSDKIWTNEAFIKAPNAGSDDHFGSSVSLSGETLVVGVPIEDSNQSTITNGSTATINNTRENSGAVYAFHRKGTTWINEAYIKAPNASAYDRFGTSLSLSGDTLSVGATGESSNQTTITNGTTNCSDNSTAGAGAVYVFRNIAH